MRAVLWRLFSAREKNFEWNRWSWTANASGVIKSSAGCTSRYAVGRLLAWGKRDAPAVSNSRCGPDKGLLQKAGERGRSEARLKPEGRKSLQEGPGSFLCL